MATHSKEFFELIRAIGESKSKQEEDKIIIKEMATLKTGMENPKVTLKLMKEYMVRVLYCEMLGHDASFGYINAIKLTSSKDMLEKRVGYLAVTLCLPPEHELLLLLISNLQNDMKSTNFISVCCALTAAAKIVNEETIPALLNHVTDLRKHSKPIVRKKVVMALHRFYQVSPSSVPDIIEYAKEALCDRDPCVMAASLCLIYDILQSPENVRALKDLIPGLVNILKQIIERKLSREFDYHRLPAPWIQIKILKNLAILGADDRAASEQIYEVLREGMQRADTGLNIGHAVVFEYVKTSTSIYPNSLLLESAASAISRFVTSSNHNLKYLGIQALTQIVKINPKYAMQHQMVVIDCLEDTDETLRRRTLELLFTMTNSNNVVVIVKRLLDFAKKSIDTHMRKELIEKIAILAKNFSPNIEWYLDTMNTLFEIDPQYIPPEAIQNMMSVIGEGVGVEEEDEEMRRHCVETFCNVVDSKNVVHDLHIQVISWVLGEYSFMNEEYTPNDILAKLCDLIDRQLEFEETRCWIVSAMAKIVAQCKEAPFEVMEYIRKYKDSKNVDLQQRCYELIALIYACNRNSWTEIMDTVLPLDGAYEDIEVDIDVSFAQDYINLMLRKGSSRYLNSSDKDRVLHSESVKPVKKSLIVTAYAPQTKAFQTPIDSGVTQPTPQDAIANRGVDTSAFSSEINATIPKKSGKGFWVDESDIQDEEVIPKKPAQVLEVTPSLPAVKHDFKEESHHKEVHKVTQPVPEKRKIKKRDEELVNGLLGGPTTTTKAVQPKKTPIKRKTSKGPNNNPNILFEEPTISTPPTQKTNTTDDIFSEMVVQEPKKTPPKSIHSELDDFFNTTTSHSVVHQEPMRPSQPLFSFDDILAPSKPSEVLNPSKPVTPQTTGDLLMPVGKGRKQNATLQQLSSQYASAYNECVNLTKDQLISVDYNKFWKSDSLIIALVISTDRGYTLSQINCQFSPPSAFSLAIDSDVESKQQKTSISFAKLDATRPITIVLTLAPQDIVMGTRLMGQLSYTNEQGSVNFMNLLLPIETIDILAPHPQFGSTRQFAEGWKKYTQEKKNTVKINGVFNINTAVETLKQKAKLTIIEIIKEEVISVAKVIGRDDVVLVHSKFTPTGAGAITVRTADKTLTENVSRLVTSIFY